MMQMKTTMIIIVKTKIKVKRSRNIIITIRIIYVLRVLVASVKRV